MAENSWRGGQTDHYGKVRYGWGMVADAFMQDPRWEDYMKVVRSKLSVGLTWRQYVAALVCTQQRSDHQARHWTHHLAMTQREPQSQGPRSQVW